MEQDINQSIIRSAYFDKKSFQKQLDIIKKASEEAQRKIDYSSAHDEEIIRAIDVVEDFLRKKHRLCYGGQAINAHLPSKYKFYDPEYAVPDYDFFTPDQATDIKTLVKDLRKVGFTEISAREGMHEGTIKIYVDFTPVADITQIDPKLYRILSSREYRYDGISYLDASTLRMLMYLELSRPRGEVDRWEKVYSRLALFNEFVSFKRCKKSDSFVGNVLHVDQAQYIMKYITENRRIFAGADLVQFYEKSYYQGRQKTNWLLSTKKPIIFLSPDATEDAKQIKTELSFMKGDNTTDDDSSITIKSVDSKGVDLIPSLKIIKQGKKTLAFIVQQVACHSYYNIPIDDNSGIGHTSQKLLRIASMDTLITLYFSLGLLDSKTFDIGAIECLANEMVELSIKARKNPDKFPFPFISIKCAGHQTSLSSLIRAKVQRITQRKKNMKGNVVANEVNQNALKTVKNTNRPPKNMNGKTKKNKIIRNKAIDNIRNSLHKSRNEGALII